MDAWVASSLRRFYPASPAETGHLLSLSAGRGERVSCQAVFRTAESDEQVMAQVETPPGIETLVRRVGYVSIKHVSTQTAADEVDGLPYIPGYAPDPLFPEPIIHAGPFETNTFWLTLSTTVDTPPGDYPITVTLSSSHGHTATLTVTLRVEPTVLAPRQNFPVTHWFYADALCDWYHTELWEERFWSILSPYLTDMVQHGQDTLYVPVFTPPLDGVKRPTQLLGVQREGVDYRFDWTLVERWVKTALAHGFTNFEWTHLFTQWGVQNAIRVYEGHGATPALLWPAETGATSDTYRGFLAQFLPQLERFVVAHGLQERSFFHLSDEPHGPVHLANYRAARELLRELAPWMRVMDALSEIEFAGAGLTDTQIPSIRTAPQFIQAGFPAWAYFCCGPRGPYLNRLLDTPLVKVRLSGWLFYRLQARGFLHWGYNYWYRRQTTELIDPYTVTDAHGWPGWAAGDPFVVYPGAAGPVDSLRWEVFAESLQDYALLQAAGIPVDDPLLADIQDYARFPRSARWITQARQKVLGCSKRAASG